MEPRLMQPRASSVPAKKAYGSTPARQLVATPIAPAAPRRQNPQPQNSIAARALCQEALQNGLFFNETTNPDSPLYRQVLALYGQMTAGPIKSRRLAVAGCSELGAALSLILAQENRKVCLLDLSNGPAMLSWMLGLKETEPGMAEMFAGDVGLEYLIVRAKTLAPVRNCFMLPKGKLSVDWNKLSHRLHALVTVLEKKFHHVILCVPDPADNPGTVRLLHELAISRALLKTKMTSEQQQKLRQALPACRIQPVS